MDVFDLNEPPYNTSLLSSTSAGADCKGKGKALSFELQPDFTPLYADGKQSVSLSKLQHYFKTRTDKSNAATLRLLLWLLDQAEPVTNDVRQNGGRLWKVNVYRRAEVDQRQFEQSQKAGLTATRRIPISTDILCAVLLQTSIHHELLEVRDVWQLKRISQRALRGQALRTVRAFKTVLAGRTEYQLARKSPEAVQAMLSLQGHSIIGSARQGQWRLVWSQTERVLDLFRQCQEARIEREEGNKEWQLENILLKSLVGSSVKDPSSHRRQWAFLSRRADLSPTGPNNRTYGFFSLFEELLQTVRSIRGEVSDKWLSIFILAVTRGTDPAIWRGSHTLSPTQYIERLPLIRRTEQLFEEQCARHGTTNDLDFIELLHFMLELELNLFFHCRRWLEAGGSVEQVHAQQHRDNAMKIISRLSAWLRTASSEETRDPIMKRRYVTSILEGMAKYTHSLIKLHLSEGNWNIAIHGLQDLLHEIKPDEHYFHLIQDKRQGRVDRRKSTARAMMSTRRLMRGCFIAITVHFGRASSQVRRLGVPFLLDLLRESIKAGVWDPWPLQSRSVRTRLKLLRLRAKLVDPPKELAQLFYRLLGVTRPVIPKHQNNVEEGYEAVEEGFQSPTFWRVIDCISESEALLRTRIKKIGTLTLENESTELEQAMKRLRDIFVKYGATAGQCTWALTANRSEVDLIAPRAELLFNKIFLPLGLPNSGWTSARRALESTLWQPGCQESGLTDKTWKQFEDAFQMCQSLRLQRNDKGEGKAHMLTGEEGSRRTRRNRQWRMLQREKLMRRQRRKRGRPPL